MKTVFLDTSYLIALVNKRDDLHAVALAASDNFHGPFLTTQLVLVELANSLCLPPLRPVAVTIIEQITKDPHTTVVACTAERFKRALSLYGNRPDKGWGLTDCFSFIVMDEAKVRQALTFDDHFRQAGYRVPLL